MTKQTIETQSSKKSYLISLMLVFLLTTMVICGILTMLGPTIGNVFSNIDCLCLYNEDGGY